MKFSLIAAAACTLASSAFAAPAWSAWPSNCLAQGTATDIVNQYVTILNHYDVKAANATAQTLLADDYIEISDSILSLEGQPLNQTTFAGKQLYINGVLNAPPVEGISTLQVLVAGCDQILWQWVFTGIGSKVAQVKGFNLFGLNAQNQIKTVHLEFNSIAWGLDTGYQVIFPPGPPPS
ncbi:hypothetical protein LTR64_005028 [Lithohypha guttulata]|uniref:uncharacterized protein n=1 Tax=Lithohypha guttulata TaxID=1690604 RepID=UPI002DDDEAD0|nr:hypothetical protein LTR51_005137 [Lithohypha guttulata]